MTKYDGWMIKSFKGRSPWLIFNFSLVKTTRKEVIEEYDKLFGKGCWKEARRSGALKLVKVKLVEVK